MLTFWSISPLNRFLSRFADLGTFFFSTTKEVIENCYFYLRAFPTARVGSREKLQPRNENEIERTDSLVASNGRLVAMAKFCESAFLSIVNPFRTSHRPYPTRPQSENLRRRTSSPTHKYLASESVAKVRRRVVHINNSSRLNFESFVI